MPRPISENLFDEDKDPNGAVFPVFFPEVTWVKLSQAAGKAGVTPDQALAVAVQEYCAKHGVY